MPPVITPAASFLGPSGDTTGATDTAAMQTLLAELLQVPGGGIQLGAGQYYWQCGQLAIARSGFYITGAGIGATFVNLIGAGDGFRMYDPSSYATRKINSGGPSGFTIDGSATTGNSAGFHVGDILQLRIDIGVRNFTAGTTSKGVWFDNQYIFTEQMAGRVFASNCAAGVVFDNSTGTTLSATATGSFDRMSLQCYILNGGVGDGVVFQGGAVGVDGNLGIFGNFIGGSAAFTPLRLTGSNGIGSSFLGNQGLQIGIELDAGGGATVPSTIISAAAGNIITACYGWMNFGANLPFTSCANPGRIFFNGPVKGDTALAASLWLNSQAQTVSGNGQTIGSNPAGVLRANPGASSFTGLILQAGTLDGQLVYVVNIGTGSLTFAAAGTSNVADGVSDVIATLTCRGFVWSAAQALWYRMGLCASAGTARGLTGITAAGRSARCVIARGGVVPRVPRGLHSPAGAYAPGMLRWGPVARPIRRLPIHLYQQRVSQIPLVGGQAQGTISAGGTLTLSVGPQGIGNLWYPASLTTSTTSGFTGSDASICNVYLGPAGVGVTLLGTLNPGSGVAAFALPGLAPGQYLIAIWSGGKSGDVATVNVVGTMDSVMPG